MVARHEREVAILLKHGGKHKLRSAVNRVLQALAVRLSGVPGQRDARDTAVLEDEQRVCLVVFGVDNPGHNLAVVHLQIGRQIRPQLRGLGVLERGDLALVDLAVVGEHEQVVGVGGIELDEGLVAVLVLQRRGLAQHAVGHLLQIAVAREHHGDGVFLNLGLEVHLDDLGRLDEAGLARHDVLLVHRGQLVVDDVFDLLLTGEDIVELGDVALELHDVPRAVHDVFLVDVAQLDFRHELGLDLVDSEALHKVGHDVGFELRTADDRDGLVDVEQDRLEAVEQMQAVGLLRQIEVHAATGRLDAPRDPLVQDLAHAHDARIAVDKHIEVAREGILQRGGAE